MVTSIAMEELQIPQSTIPTSATSEITADCVTMTLTSNEALGTLDGGSSSAHRLASRELREENWNVVRLGDGYGRLHKVPVRHGLTCSDTLTKVRADAGTTKTVKVILNKILYFGEEAVFEAPITLRIDNGDEAQHPFVDVGTLVYDPLLTAAYHGRLNLGGTNFVADNMRFTRNDRALVIGWKISKTYTMSCVLFFCGLSIGLGVLVGLVCHDAGLGIAVGASAAGVVAAVTAVLTKLAK